MTVQISIPGVALCALLSSLPARAQTMAPEEVAATIRALQARVETLEARSRRDRADADAARAELRVMKSGRRASPTKIVSAPYLPAVVNTPYVQQSPISGFDGPYAALIGGYQFGTQRQRLQNFGAFANVEAVAGGNVGGAFGYNTTSGNLLFGLEARGRKEFDEAVSTFDSGPTGFSGFPVSIGGGSSSCCSTPGRTPLPLFGDYTLAYRVLGKDRLTRDFGGDVSARLGMTFDETLVYVRLGAGADAVRRASTYDMSQTLVCRSPVAVRDTQLGGTFQDSIIGCGAVTGGSVTRISKQVAAPYTVLGLGVEQNFGPMFVRAEGAFLVHYRNLGTPASGLSDPYYTTEVTGAVGYRF